MGPVAPCITLLAMELCRIVIYRVFSKNAVSRVVRVEPVLLFEPLGSIEILLEMVLFQGTP
jgi:hypothetical protein